MSPLHRLLAHITGAVANPWNYTACPNAIETGQHPLMERKPASQQRVRLTFSPVGPRKLERKFVFAARILTESRIGSCIAATLAARLRLNRMFDGGHRL
jgi:hypothetical protein